MDSSVNFIAGMAYAHDRLFVAGSPESDPPYTPYSVWYVYIADDKAEPWSHFITRWWAVNCCKYVPVNPAEDWALIGLSNEGHLDFNYGESGIAEKIPGAGVFSEGAAGWGYMSRLRQIGEHLYACGDGGQVYRRHGPDDWRHIDAGLLQTPPITDRLQLNCINGLTEDDIYLAGDFPGPAGLEGRLFHFDGSAWHPLTIPPVGYLNAIHIESAERIWVCGENGALLLGNARDGFHNLSRIEDNQLFYSLTLFGGLLYLASNLGLFSYNPAHPDAGLREVVTGLTPELQDAHIVDACDGVLWSIGFKDIVRFNGTRWERIHHPDNPKIGA